MADTTYTIGLEAEGDGAASVEAQLNALQRQIKADTAELANLKAAMANVASGSDTFKKLETQAAALKGKVSENSEAFLKLGGSFKALASASKPEAAASIEQMTYLAKGAMGPMGGLFERVTMLAKGLMSLGPAAAGIAIAVVLLAVTSALITATVALAQYGFETSSAAMKSRELLEGAVGGAKAADALTSSVNKVAAAVPLSTKEVEKLGTKLYATGLRGAELEKALMKASLEAAGLGKNASPDLIRRRMLGLDIQTMKLKENIAKIFSGLKLERFLGAIQEVLSIFAEGESSSSALKIAFESLFQPLFDGAVPLGPIVKNLFRGMVIGALLVTKAILVTKNAFASMIPGGLPSQIDWLKTAVYVGAGAVIALAVAVGVLAVVLAVALVVALAASAFVFISVALAAAVLLVGIVMLLAAFLLVPALVLAAVYGLYKLGEYLMGLAGIGSSAASGLIDGLVNGITSGAASVMAAITNLAGGMKSAIMSALGIASPSKVFAKLGGYTAEGFALGIESGDSRVAGASEKLAAAPVIGAAQTVQSAKGSASASRSGGGASITIHIHGVKGAEEMRDESFWSRVCEQVEEACHVSAIPLEAT